MRRLVLLILMINITTGCTEKVCNIYWIDGLGNSQLVDADEKPEGELIEIADAIIRLADYCGRNGWDLEEAVNLKMQYNKTRPYKHGKLL